MRLSMRDRDRGPYSLFRRSILRCGVSDRERAEDSNAQIPFQPGHIESRSRNSSGSTRSSIEDEIAFRRTYARETRSGVCFKIGFGDVIDLAGKNCDLAGPATSRAAAARNIDAVRFNEFQQIGVLTGPVHGLTGLLELHSKSGWRTDPGSANDGNLFHAGRPKCFVVDVCLRARPILLDLR